MSGHACVRECLHRRCLLLGWARCSLPQRPPAAAARCRQRFNAALFRATEPYLPQGLATQLIQQEEADRVRQLEQQAQRRVALAQEEEAAQAKLEQQRQQWERRRAQQLRQQQAPPPEE